MCATSSNYLAGHRREPAEVGDNNGEQQDDGGGGGGGGGEGEEQEGGEERNRGRARADFGEGSSASSCSYF